MKRAAVLIAMLLVVSPLFAQTPPASQTIGGQSRQQKEIDKQREVEKKIQSKKPQEAGTAAEALADQESGPTVLVNTISVEGATILSQDEIKRVTAQYEGRQLSMRTIQKTADLITDLYRTKGYATSRAYIPPQTIRDGVLIIRVIEGRLGKVDIKGNKYYKTSLIRDRLALAPAGYFDYSALQRSMVYVNEQSDIKAKATLVPGAEAGTTDVVIEVADQLPVHAGFEFDNYGSRYINKNRYSLVFEHNNLFGFADKLYLKAQRAEADRMHLEQGRYTFPISSTLDVGAYAVNSKMKLGKEFKDVDARGKAEIYGVFANQSLVHNQDLDIRLNAGFDYKSIHNYLLGAQSSRDEVRMLKAGADVDILDPWGRNVIMPELNQGFGDILGGMADKDPNASRSGAGGRFTKAVLNYYRLQKLPYEMTFLWKNNAQFTNHNLVASEQFQVGGATSVRGYAPAEKSGDKGLYTSPEVSFPIYFMNKDSKLPFAKNPGETWYNALRCVVFYDWGTAHVRTPAAGEKKHETLRSVGFGWRFNFRDTIAARLEIGYPLGDKTPSDGDHAHPWVEVITRF